MDTTLFGISALQFHDTPPLALQRMIPMNAPVRDGATIGSSMPEIAPRSSSPADAHVVQRHLLGALKGVGLPVHLVGNRRSPCRNPHIRWHRLEIPYAPCDLQRIADGLYVTTPLRTLLDIARSMTLVQLLRIIYSWCGLYAVSPATARLRLALEQLVDDGLLREGMGRKLFAFHGIDGRRLPLLDEHGAPPAWEPCFDKRGNLSDLWKRPPLIDHVELKRYICRLGACDGVARLRRAAELALPGSASPLETTHALLAHLPRKLGGEGLPRPLLNRQIALSPHAARALGQTLCVGDVTWDDGVGGLLPACTEVDGVAFHEPGGVLRELPTGEHVAARDDSSRASALESMGFTVISSTFAQMVNVNRWELLMDRIAEALDVERKRQTPAFMRQRARLRDELFGPPRAYGVGV